MPLEPLQELKWAARCGSAGKASHDATKPGGRPDTPPPEPALGPRPLFSLPVAPPRAFYTRKMDKAIERLESSKNAELQKSGSRKEAMHGGNGGLTSTNTTLSPIISSVGKNHSSTDEIAVTDNVTFDGLFEPTKSDSGKATFREIMGRLTSKDTLPRPTVSSVEKSYPLIDDIFATDNVDSDNSFESRKSDSTSANSREEIGRPTPRNTPPRPTISSLKKQSKSADKVDAVGIIDDADAIVLSKSGSRREVTSEKIGRLPSRNAPAPANISVKKNQSTSADEIDVDEETESDNDVDEETESDDDVFEYHVIVKKAKKPSLGAKEASHQYGDVGPKEARLTDADQTIENDFDQTIDKVFDQTIENDFGQTSEVYDWAEHQTLKHKQKRASLRLEPHVTKSETDFPARSSGLYDGTEHQTLKRQQKRASLRLEPHVTKSETDFPARSSEVYDWTEHQILKRQQKRASLRLKPHMTKSETDFTARSAETSPDGSHTPRDLTFGILRQPTYKSSARPDETSTPKVPVKKDKNKMHFEKQPAEDLISTQSSASHSLSLRGALSSSARRKPLWCHQPHLPPTNVCTSRLCPVLGPHRVGFYLHHNTKRTRPEIYFGDSNPPPMVWYAVDLMAKGKANSRDEEIVREFIRFHYFVAREGGIVN